jgi:MraZ protein
MALTGTYLRNLDDKQRLAVPKQLREQFSEGKLSHLYLAPGTDRSLAVYSPDAFGELATRITERSSNRAEFRNYLRLFYAQAEQVALDGQGRIRVPERLAEFAQLKHDIVLVGVHDHAEIWDSKLWEEFLSRHSTDFDDMAANALS